MVEAEAMVEAEDRVGTEVDTETIRATTVETIKATIRATTMKAIKRTISGTIRETIKVFDLICMIIC